PQHVVSALLEEDIAQARLTAAAADTRELARLTSGRARYSGAWLHGVPGEPTPDLWLTPPEFSTAMRYRLGLPVAEAGAPCGLCRKQTEPSSHGGHVLTCLNGGHRTLLHHAIVRQVHGVASAALLQVAVEVNLGTLPATRADLVVRDAPNDATWVLDVAVT